MSEWQSHQRAFLEELRHVEMLKKNLLEHMMFIKIVSLSLRLNRLLIVKKQVLKNRYII